MTFLKVATPRMDEEQHEALPFSTRQFTVNEVGNVAASFHESYLSSFVRAILPAVLARADSVIK